MSRFENHGLQAGIWSGILTADRKPARVYLLLRGEIVSFAQLTDSGEGGWKVAVELPSEAIFDGVHCFILATDMAEGNAPPSPGAEHLDHLKLVAGEPLNEDLAAEIEMLRAELELLKREFRRLATAE